jgi:hypothetical protein
MDFGGWSIWVRKDRTSIGCQDHKNSQWLKWTPDDVADFDPGAATWWAKYGDTIRAAILAVQQ